jgi:hypothetical protein
MPQRARRMMCCTQQSSCVAHDKLSLTTEFQNSCGSPGVLCAGLTPPDPGALVFALAELAAANGDWKDGL